jgi:hypothetical protein
MLVLVLLYAQLATAAYACPANAGEPTPAAEMPCVGSMDDGGLQVMDPDQAALCLEHCKSGAKAVDAGHAPLPLPLTAIAPLVVVLFDDFEAVDARSWASHARERERTRPPAHSILHCCRRD